MELLADRLESMSYLLRPAHAGSDGPHPVLCFLHGYDEGAPSPIRWALTEHGPLNPEASAWAASFLVVAPQLPYRSDAWNRFAPAVREIVLDVRARFDGDPRRTYLTGFGYGGNGVLDLGRVQPDLWAALWAVDPTRVPRRRLARPLHLTLGEAARAHRDQFVESLGLARVDDDPEGKRVYLDHGADALASAAMAYGDARAYEWLLRHRAATGAFTGDDLGRRRARRVAWRDALSEHSDRRKRAAPTSRHTSR